MRRLLATAILVATCAVAWLPTPAVAAPQSRRVVVVLAPYLTWEDITATSTPTMWSLVRTGAVGDVNARSRARDQGEKGSPLEGALTISAGTWAVQDPTAAGAFAVDERFEVGSAAEAFRRMTGGRVGSNALVFLGMPQTRRVNAERSSEVVLGTLGQAIRDAGGVTAAVGNSDWGYATGEHRSVRPAALVAMDTSGLVRFGDVSGDLLREDSYAPFGVATDLERFQAAAQAAERDTAAAKGPALVVLDAGDGYRAAKFASQVSDEVAVEQRARALRTLDAVVAMAREAFPNDVLMVVAQSSAEPDVAKPEGFGPIIVSGEGWDGLLASNSTHRDGIVSNLDVTATILRELGLERPVQVLGDAMTANPSAANADERVARLRQLNTAAVSVDQPRTRVINLFVIAVVLVMLLSAFVIVRSGLWPAAFVTGWVKGLQLAILFVLCVPVSSWLMFAWMPYPSSQATAVIALLLTAFVLWLAALLIWVKLPGRAPLVFVSLVTAGVLMLDQVLGAPWSFTGMFGYSPLWAARYYGIGNEGAALLFGSAVVGVALLFDQRPGSRFTSAGKRYGLPLLAVAVIGLAAAPFFGANVGVVAWGTIGFGVAYVLMNGHHVSLRTVMIMLGIVALVVAVFAAVDLFGGGAQTHLGRAITSAEQGGVGELWQIVARKAETNMRVLTHTNWSYILIAVMAFLGFMRLRPKGDFADTLAENPDFADAIAVALVAGLVAYFTEDSGIVIPALEMLFVGAGIAWLMLDRLVGREVSPATGDRR